MIIRKEFAFPASGDGHSLFGCVWIEEEFDEYKGIVQIAHGMEEHILRYQSFAVFLANQGFIVCGNDHTGHGQSIEHEEDKGYFGECEDSWRFLLSDMRYVMTFVKEKFYDLPYFILGHSMGSFLAREFAVEYGEDIQGAIFMGTSGGNSFLDIGIALAEEGVKIKGAKRRAYAISRLAFGAFNIKISERHTDYDWLSSDTESVDRFIEDERCGFVFTYAGFRELFRMLKSVSSLNWAKKLNKKLPILVISGKEDPVGEYGKGVKRVYGWLKSAECENITLKIYEGGRHELLNERFNSKVYRFLLRWLHEQL